MISFFWITFVTSRYVGGLVLNEEDGGGGGGGVSNRGIQLGVLKNTFGLIFLETFLKYVVQTSLLNDGKILLTRIQELFSIFPDTRMLEKCIVICSIYCVFMVIDRFLRVFFSASILFFSIQT